MLKKIEIRGLFGRFDYDIELKEDGLTILTGPNGYGKTTILRVIHDFAVKAPPLFFDLPFTKITFFLEKAEIPFSKDDTHDVLTIGLGDEESITLNRKNLFSKVDQLLQEMGYLPAGADQWLDRKTGSVCTTEKLRAELNRNRINIQEELLKRWPQELGGLRAFMELDGLTDVYFIQEQRLLSKVSDEGVPSQHGFGHEVRESLWHTIELGAQDLSITLNNALAEASRKGQELDGSFPERLFEESGSINEREFAERYDAVKGKQKLLSRYGLSATREERHTAFKQENARALLVYLNDTEQKLAVFDDLLQRLEVFSSILEKRRFISKRLEIGPEFGFRFKTEEGKELPLTALSSGEQQEVVLLYELLFRVKPNTLVLIDEPELSLHVVWQKAFLDDLLRIIALQKIQVMVATHSPQIIGEHWDREIDLYEIAQ